MPPSRPPLFVLVFFSLFGFIGITVLYFLWAKSGGMGDPPLFFKVMGSFVALGFIAMGFGVPLTALRRGKEAPRSGADRTPGPSAGTYVCPSCGANVKDAEVSPGGDVKCTYCNGWWNIHRNTR